MASMRGTILGLATAWLLAAAWPAGAQAGRGGLRIDGFDLEQVASLAPGTVLNFSVFATPGASASVLIEGSPRLLELRETQPGVYEGAYAIRPGERLDPRAHVVATLWRDGAVARSTLEETLLLDDAPPIARSAAPSRSPVPRPVPAAPAAVSLPPSDEPMLEPAPARSIEPDRTPRLAAGSTAVPAPFPAPTAAATPLAAVGFDTGCATCARVESIRAVEIESGAARAGKFAGGVAGALFGEEIGRAHARHVTGLLSVLGGTPAGRDGGQRTAYEATLRLPDGSQRARRYDALPPFRIGDTVRLEQAGADRR
jgi:hypothetical protein